MSNTATEQHSTQRLLSPDEVERARGMIGQLLNGLGTAILGQQELLELVTICLLARGHMLLEGLPGLGKTELVKSLSALLGLGFRRVQFTPDLLPSDILGTSVYDTKTGEFNYLKGPIFANIVLADEINRTTPRTQSALLEAMSEEQI